MSENSDEMKIPQKGIFCLFICWQTFFSNLFILFRHHYYAKYIMFLISLTLVIFIYDFYPIVKYSKFSLNFTFGERVKHT